MRVALMTMVLALAPSPIVENWVECKKWDSESAIAACTAIINSGAKTNPAESFSNNSLAEAYYLRAGRYAEKKQSDQALADYSRAIELDPNFHAAYNDRGIFFTSLEKYELAILDFDHAIVLNPDFNLAISNRAFAYLKSGKYSMAIAEYDRVIAQNIFGYSAYNYRGEAYMKLGNLELAERDFRSSLEQFENEDARKGLKSLEGLQAKKAETDNKSHAESKKTEAVANTDISGRLLDKKAAASAKACAAVCQVDDACIGWTYNVWNKFCFTKESADELLYEPSSVSGMAKGNRFPERSRLPMVMKRFRGKSFPLDGAISVPAVTFEACETKCRTQKSCSAFTFISAKEICYTFNRTHTAYDTFVGADSGVKRQVP